MYALATLAAHWLLLVFAFSACSAWRPASPLRHAEFGRTLPSWTWWRRCAPRPLQCNTVQEFSPILITPMGPIDGASAVDFIHKWSRDQVLIGSTFTVQTTKTGARFHFTPAPGCVLTLQAGEVNGEAVIEESLQVQFGGRVGASSMEDLVRSAAKSIVSSFRDDFSAYVASLALSEGGKKEAEEKCVVQVQEFSSGGMVELSENDIDMDYIHANAKDLSADIQSHIASLFSPEPIAPTKEMQAVVEATSALDGNSAIERHPTINSSIHNTEVLPSPTVHQSPITSESILCTLPAGYSLTSSRAFLQSWVRREYDKPSLGISVSPLPEGVHMDFAVDDQAFLQLLVLTQDNGAVLSQRWRTSQGSDAHPSHDLQAVMLGIAQRLCSAVLKHHHSSSSSVDSREADNVSPTSRESRPPPSSVFSEAKPRPASPPRAGQTASPPLPSDPATQYAAQSMGMSEDQLSQAAAQTAAKELQALIQERSAQGFAAVLRDLQSSVSAADMTEESPASLSQPTAAAAAAVAANTSRPLQQAELDYLFSLGRNMSQQHVLKLLDRPPASPFYETPADLRGEPTVLPDTLTSHPGEGRGDTDQDLTAALSSLADAFPAASLAPDAASHNLTAVELVADRQKLAFLVAELNQSAPELHDLVLDGFPDLLLSDHLMQILSEAASTEHDARLRQLYKKIVDKAVAAHVQLAVKMKQESQRHLQTILEVCEAFIRHSSNEKALLEAINLLRPRMDASLLAYLNHALQEAQQQQEEEEGPKTASVADLYPSAGMRPSQGWARILQIMRTGVVAELEQRYEWLLEVLTFVVRFHEQPEVQAELFRRLVEKCVATNLGTMRQLARNMVEHVLSKPSLQTKQWLGREADGRQKMQRLGELVETFLSDEVIQDRMQAYEKEIETQGMELAYRYRDAVRQNEMAASRELETRAILEGGGRGIDLPGIA